MSNGVVTKQDGQKLTLEDLTGSGGLWFQAVAHLYSNNLTPIRASVLGDFTEATYPGYAAQTLAWQLPATDDGTHEQVFADAVFPANGGPNYDVFGFYITDNTGALLLGAVAWTNPPTVVTIPAGLGMGLHVVFQDKSEF